MNKHQRPWWAFALRMPILDTTLTEAHRPGQKRFVLDGQPIIKSLNWIVYGPILAILAVAILGALSWILEINAQSRMTKLTFVCLLGIVPIAVWVAGSYLLGKLGQPYLDKEMQAHSQHVELILDLNKKTLQLNQTPPIPFADIEDFKLVSDSGVYYSPEESTTSIVNLFMDTKQGQITVLSKELGNIKQKLQLIDQLQATLNSEGE